MRKTRDESQEREDPDARNRRILGLAALEASGAGGYRNLTVEGILKRADLDAEAFYAAFDDPSACYASGYATTVDALVVDLFDATRRKEGWVQRMRVGLEALGRFLETERTLAQGIFLEVHTAGGAAAAKRDEVFERLSRAIDTARREKKSRHSPPPIAATFILSMVEAAASQWLRTAKPGPFADEVSDLLYVAATFYFGREEAGRQVG